MKSFDENAREYAESKRQKELAEEIEKEFLKRREDRRRIESGWVLNLKFLKGEQYCDVLPSGVVAETEKRYYWQSRRVFNRIAPTVDSRLAKLEKMQPTLNVRAFSEENADVKAAALSTGILSYVKDRIRLSEIVSKVTLWAEACGSAFYKVLWNEKGGRQVGVDGENEPIYEGETEVVCVPPFEIFPDNLSVEGLESVNSLIHAQAVTTAYVAEKFGVEVKGKPMKEVAWTEYSNAALDKDFFEGKEGDGVILLERYTLPDKVHKRGRLEIVAGGQLLYEGDLPYVNGERSRRGFPFIKQDCLRLPGSFFAGCVVERLIPLQRAYNAVRNRKHEFLNRLSMGVLTVEDGAVDTDELAEEGLLPGKVLVYRQGAKAPEMLDCGSVPAEFSEEESWLEREFEVIGGVSELMQNSSPTRVTSATGLQILLSHDDSKLAVTSGSMQRAMKEIGKHILRLYRQFAGNARLMTMTGENKQMKVVYFNAAELSANDILIEAEVASDPAEKKETLLKLYDAGLLSNDDGKVTMENKARILEAFGFGSYENAKDISSLHLGKAGEENVQMKTEDVDIDGYDDHALHINEHTRFLLSAEFKKLYQKDEQGKALKARYAQHIAAHKEAKKQGE